MTHNNYTHIFAVRCLAALSLFWGCSAASAADIKGSVTTQWQYFPDSEPQNHSYGRAATLELDLFQRFDNTELVAELLGRFDDRDSGRRTLDARQAYVKSEAFGVDLFLGNRQVFWGKAESKNIVDVINQRDAAANSGQVEKKGALSVSAEKYSGDLEFQFFYIPEFRTKTSNDPDAHPSAGMASTAPRFARQNGKNADDFAARISGYTGDWDYALSGFYGTARDPIISVTAEGKILPYYVLQRSIGLEGQYTSDAILVKLEGLFGTQHNADFSALVTGVEKTLYAVWDTQWDIGLIGEVQMDDRPQAADELFGVAGVRLVINDPEDTNFLALYSADREHDQTLFSIEASRRLSERFFVELSGQFYNARSVSSPFGLLSDDDQISARLKWFF